MMFHLFSTQSPVSSALFVGAVVITTFCISSPSSSCVPFIIFTHREFNTNAKKKMQSYNESWCKQRYNSKKNNSYLRTHKIGFRQTERDVIGKIQYGAHNEKKTHTGLLFTLEAFPNQSISMWSRNFHSTGGGKKRSTLML